MAITVKELLIRITGDTKGATSELDKFDKALDKETKKLDQWGKGFRVMGAALTAFGVGTALFMKSSVEEYGKAEKSLLKLENTISNMPALQGANIAAFQAQAAALQKMTAAEDDVIIEGMAMLGTFRLNQAQLQAMMPLVVDYSRKFGIDMASAAIQVGKALDGQVGALRRNGVSIDETVFKVDRFRAVQEALQEQVGGFSTKEGKTFQGQLERLGNQFGDLKESIGGTILPALQSILEPIVKLVNHFNNLSPAMKKNAGYGLLVASGLALIGGPTLLLIGYLPKLIAGFKVLSIWMAASNLSAAGLAIAIGEVAITIALLVAAYYVVADTAEKTRKEYDSLTESQKKGVEQYYRLRYGSKGLQDVLQGTSKETDLFAEAQNKVNAAIKKAIPTLAELGKQEDSASKKHEEAKRTWEVISLRALETELAQREAAHDKEINNIESARDKKLARLEQGKEAALKTIDAELTAREKADNAREKSLDRQLDDAEKVKDATLTSLEKQKDAALKTIGDQIDAYDKLYDAQLQTLDIDTKTALAGIDAQIEGIRDQAEAERRAREETARGKELTELRSQLAILKGKEILSDSEKKEAASLEAEIAKIEETARLEKLALERADLVEALQDKKDLIRQEAEAKREQIRLDKEAFLVSMEEQKAAATLRYETEKVAAVAAYAEIQTAVAAQKTALSDEAAAFKEVKDAEKTKIGETYDKAIQTANDAATNAIAQINAQWKAFQTMDDDIKNRYEDNTKIHADNLEAQYNDEVAYVKALTALYKTAFVEPPSFIAPSRGRPVQHWPLPPDYAEGQRQGDNPAAAGMVPISGGGWLSRTAGALWDKMYNFAKGLGVTLHATDTWRSFAQQLALYFAKPDLALDPRETTSHHQLGRAVDVDKSTQDFMRTYGGLFSWQGIPKEAWHFDFMGAFQKGGILPKTGFYLGHKGETVTPPGASPVEIKLTLVGGMERFIEAEVNGKIQKLTAGANLLSQVGFV